MSVFYAVKIGLSRHGVGQPCFFDAMSVNGDHTDCDVLRSY